MIDFINIALVSMGAVVVWGLARSTDLLVSVIFLAIFSLLATTLFLLFDAVDVAFTEAAVGTGASTLLFLAALLTTGRHEKAPRRKLSLRPAPLILALTAAAALVYAVAGLPDFGDPLAPIQQHVAPRYLGSSAFEVGPPNVVTSVLASYRGYDTLGEVLVVLTGGIGIMLLLAPGCPAPDHRSRELHSNPVLAKFGALSLLPIMLFACYVQWHGDYGPGGGFQAGVLFAAAIILYSMVFGADRAQRALAPSIAFAFALFGAGLYIAVGLLGIERGEQFLNYSPLADYLAALPAGWFGDAGASALDGQHLGILAVELGIGICVASTLICVFHRLAGPIVRSPAAGAAVLAGGAGDRQERAS